MKKKGFTLVELLAVIAILAILVIIALPNVMGMFNSAKKSSFETEIKEMIKGAQNQFLTDQFGTGQSQTTYASSGATGTKKIESMNVRAGLKYEIKMDTAGKITSAKFSDGSYWYSSGTVTDLSVEDISDSNIKITADTADTTGLSS